MGSDLGARLIAADRSAVPEALNLVDDRRPARREHARALLDTLAAEAHTRAHRIGLTGAPGAGKSTLLDALVRRLREAGRTVGIVAVDPSSQQTGGALLGDRFRVRSGARDDGVYFRSMAARERLGGLADAAYASVEILASVFDVVFVETVGVGQSESEAAWLVDTLVYVAQPDAGDALQFMKAGVLELPDVFVVNKADRGATAERTASELSAGLGGGAGGAGGSGGESARAPVLLVSARDDVGVEAVVDALEAHRAALEAAGALAERRHRGRVAFVRSALAQRYGSYGLEQIGGAGALEMRVREAEEQSVQSLVHAAGLEIEDSLQKPEGSRPAEGSSTAEGSR